MTDTEKKIAFLLTTSQYLIPSWDCTYEEAAKDLIANGVMVQKQGRWKHFTRRYAGLDVCYVRCSACGSERGFVYGLKYCPHCGAKMDADRRDE